MPVGVAFVLTALNGKQRREKPISAFERERGVSWFLFFSGNQHEANPFFFVLLQLASKQSLKQLSSFIGSTKSAIKAPPPSGPHNRPVIPFHPWQHYPPSSPPPPQMAWCLRSRYVAAGFHVVINW